MHGTWHSSIGINIEADWGVIDVRIFVLSRRKLIFGILFLITVGVLIAISLRSLTIPSLVRAPGTYYMAHTQEKFIALTFDDGPDSIDTPEVLDILKEKNVRATFFVLGQAAHANPLLLKRLVMEGHEIGNHSFRHDYQQRRLVEEIKQTDQEVFAATGTHTYFYRPPGGFLSQNQLKTIQKMVTWWHCGVWIAETGVTQALNKLWTMLLKMFSPAPLYSCMMGVTSVRKPLKRWVRLLMLSKGAAID
jgi:Predicted xylanase/chitin deacetylase